MLRSDPILVSNTLLQQACIKAGSEREIANHKHVSTQGTEAIQIIIIYPLSTTPKFIQS